MKFAARDGLSARTLAFTASPSARTATPTHASPGWFTENAPRKASSSVQIIDERAVVDRPRAKPTTQNFLRGQELFNPGTGQGMVYIVRSGCIRLYKVLPDGRSM